MTKDTMWTYIMIRRITMRMMTWIGDDRMTALDYVPVGAMNMIG